MLSLGSKLKWPQSKEFTFRKEEHQSGISCDQIILVYTQWDQAHKWDQFTYFLLLPKNSPSLWTSFTVLIVRVWNSYTNLTKTTTTAVGSYKGNIPVDVFPVKNTTRRYSYCRGLDTDPNIVDDWIGLLMGWQTVNTQHIMISNSNRSILWSVNWWLVESPSWLLFFFCLKILGRWWELTNGTFSLPECRLSSGDTWTLPALIEFTWTFWDSEMTGTLKCHSRTVCTPHAPTSHIEKLSAPNIYC